MKKGYKRNAAGIFAALIMVLTVSGVPAGGRVQAASASISIETEDALVQVGDTVTVELVLQGTTRLGGFEAFLTYNPSALEFQSADGPVAGGEGMLRISDMEPMERTKKRIYTITFTAVGVGGCEIAMRDKAHVYEDEGGNEMSVSSNSLSVKVEAAAEAGSNTRLKTLKVSPAGLIPEFAPEITEYELQAEGEVSALVISAVPEDEAATVAVTGNQNFSEGENLVEITVKAENTDVQVYRIRVYKNAGLPAEDGKTENGEGASRDGFSVTENGDGFDLAGSYHVHVTEAPQAAMAEIPEYEPYTLVLYGSRIPAYRKAAESGDPVSVLVYVSGTPEETGFYEFQMEERNLVRLKTILQEKEVEIIKEVDTEDPWILYIIIVVLALVCAFLGIGLIQAGRRRRL